MNELVNKYTEERDKFFDLLIQYHSSHLNFMRRQSPRFTADMRKILKEMRITLKNMETVAQLRMKERRVEWAAKTKKRIKKNEQHNRIDPGSS